VLAAVASVAIAAAGPAYAQFLDWRVAIIDLAHAPPPPVAAAWTPSAPEANDWKPVVADPDRSFFEAFSDGHGRVLRFVALYATGGQHNNLVRGGNTIAPEPRWHLAAAHRTSVAIAGNETTLTASEIEDPQRRMLVWQFYVVGGKVLTGPMAVKLAQLKGMVTGGTGTSAYVAIAVPAGRDAAATLARFVNGMAPLGGYLRSLH
jgi:EpsI family protein